MLIYSDNHALVAEMLGGYMAGVTVSGVLWAIFQNNAGGAWDNAKKSFEAGVMINGEMTYKGSDAHKAAVTGDTVGDPFKDTSGPSMNILIKLTCLIGLVIAPILGSHTEAAEVGATQQQEQTITHEPVLVGQEQTEDISVDKQVDANGNVTATVTISTKTSAEEVKTEEKVFKGTAADVDAQIEALKTKK
jgi:K(+)-stimulated pyrophosphate-energized sodium pump